jgi:hypothetical protein
MLSLRNDLDRYVLSEVPRYASLREMEARSPETVAALNLLLPEVGVQIVDALFALDEALRVAWRNSPADFRMDAMVSDFEAAAKDFLGERIGYASNEQLRSVVYSVVCVQASPMKSVLLTTRWKGLHSTCSISFLQIFE